MVNIKALGKIINDTENILNRIVFYGISFTEEGAEAHELISTGLDKLDALRDEEGGD